MASYTVTTTQDTDPGLTPPPADAAGSLRAAVDAANATGGGAISVSLPAGSTIALLDDLPDLTGVTSLDFTGAPGVVLTSSASGSSTDTPYNNLVVDGALTLSGVLTGDANSGVLLGVFPTGSATLAPGAALIGNTTSLSFPTLLDAGVSLTLGANARVSAVGANAIDVTQGYGAVANQTVTIAAGAVVSDTAASAPTIYVAGSAQGAVITNSGTLTGTSVNTYYTASSSTFTNNSTLVNTSSGLVTGSSTSGNATVNLGGGAMLQNAGTISQTGNSNAVYNTGVGAVTNTGSLTSVNNVAYYASGASTLTNSGTISSSNAGGYEAGNTSTPGAATLVNQAGGAITASNGTTVFLTGTATLQNAGTVTNTGGYNAVDVYGTGAIVNSGTVTSAGAATVYLSFASTLTNTGSIVNNTTGTGGPTVVAAGAATIVNSGSITSTAMSSSFAGLESGDAVSLQSGASLTSTGVISANSSTNYAIISNGTSGAETITLGAGSTTTGAVGGTSGAALAITVAGSLNGAVVGGAEADTLRLVDGLSLTGAINLGGGADVLTLDGASGSSTLASASVQSAVALVKTGAGAWTLSGAGANYTGVALNGGTLELAAASSAGAGAITFGAGPQVLQLDMPASGGFALANTLTGFGTEDAIDVHGATVTATSVSGDVLTLTTSAGAVTLNFAQGTLAQHALAVVSDGAGGSVVTLGPLIAPATVAPGQTVSLAPPTSGTSSTAPTVVTGDVTDNGSAQIGGTGPVTYTGAISGTGSLTVSGASTVTLTGTSTYTGPTTVASGALIVNGSIANSPVTVDSGAVLGGNGTTGALTAQSGATVSPGNSPGVINTTGDLNLATGSILLEQISGVVNGSASTTFDQINVTGKADLNGATLNAVLYGGFTPPTAGTAAFSIIHTTGGVTGTFAGLAEGATFTLGGEQVTISYVGGADHDDVTLQFAAPPTTPVVTPPTIPALPPSQQAGFATAIDNLIRVAASDPSLSNVLSPQYAQVQAEKGIAAQLDAGLLSAPDAQSALYHLVDGTTSVAEIDYAFFTGKTPTAAGLNYLVSSSANPNNLESAYYAQFSTENRYINFANNLATGSGAGAAAFQASYGSLSLSDAVTKAYTAVFGVTPTADKVSAILNAPVSNGLGGTETRAQYFADITGGSAISQKAAAIGFLLSDSVKEGFGLYQQADLHFLQDLAHGSAVFNVDLLAAYTPPAPTLVGQPVVDPTLGT